MKLVASFNGCGCPILAAPLTVSDLIQAAFDHRAVTSHGQVLASALREARRLKQKQAAGDVLVSEDYLATMACTEHVDMKTLPAAIVAYDRLAPNDIDEWRSCLTANAEILLAHLATRI